MAKSRTSVADTELTVPTRAEPMAWACSARPSSISFERMRSDSSAAAFVVKVVAMMADGDNPSLMRSASLPVIV